MNKTSGNINVEPRYCQSCGMPLDINRKDLFGTNQDGTLNNEYCCCCLQNGKFTVDLPINKAVETWAETYDLFNQNIQTSYTPTEFKRVLKKRLPSLKRWQQKNATKHIHFEIINKIMTYINSHLFEDLDIDILSQNANLSKFYFTRIFKDVTGEKLGNYIMRLRLEHIAHLLIATELSLVQITHRVNYRSKHSLSKAFKAYFGIPPSAYRKRHRIPNDMLQYLSMNIMDRLERVKELNVLYRLIDVKRKTNQNCRNHWEELIAYSERLNIENSFNKNYVSVNLDDPSITQYTNCRFYIGVTIPLGVQANEAFGVMQIPERNYAVFKHVGDYSSLHKLYREIYLSWFPQSGYRQNGTHSFEMYMSTPLDTDPINLETHIYIPIEKI